MEERYSFRYYYKPGEDVEIQVPRKPEPAEVLEIAKVWGGIHTPDKLGMHWVIYDRARGVIAAEDSGCAEGVWVNPVWLIETGLHHE